MGLGSIVKKVTKTAKKALPYAAAAAGAYYGGQYLMGSDLFSSAADAVSGSGIMNSLKEYSPLISAASPIIAGGLSYMGAVSANEANSREAALNRQFQEYMRATQYQTAVRDMKAAGLNPMLTYQQGGAGNLNGSVAAPYQNALGQSVNSSLAAKQAQASVENMEAQNVNLKAQTPLIGAQAAQAAEHAQLMKTQSATEAARTIREVQGTKLDAARFQLEKRMGLSLAGLQAAQARNYDANSAHSVIRKQLDEYDIPRRKHDADINSTTAGKLWHNWNYIFRNATGRDR